jgi:heme A synthase
LTNDSGVQSRGVLGFFVREGTSVIFAFLVWYAIWGGYAPSFGTPELAFRHAVIAGMVTLIYIGLQALAVVSAPLARETRYLLDLLLSLVPLAIVGYAVVQNLSGYLPLTEYQKAVLWLAGTACVIDVVIFTWFNMKVNKLASDFVQMR